MTAKLTASADGTKVTIGTAAEDALQIDSVTKKVSAVSPYQLFLGAGLSAENGYQHLPNGILIQWGKNTGNGQRDVTFPTPFSICYNVVAVTVASDVTILWGVQVTGRSPTGFTVTCNALLANLSAIVPAGEDIMWFAVGLAP